MICFLCDQQTNDYYKVSNKVVCAECFQDPLADLADDLRKLKAVVFSMIGH